MHLPYAVWLMYKARFTQVHQSLHQRYAGRVLTTPSLVEVLLFLGRCLEWFADLYAACKLHHKLACSAERRERVLTRVRIDLFLPPGRVLLHYTPVSWVRYVHPAVWMPVWSSASCCTNEIRWFRFLHQQRIMKRNWGQRLIVKMGS